MIDGASRPCAAPHGTAATAVAVVAMLGFGVAVHGDDVDVSAECSFKPSTDYGDPAGPTVPAASPAVCCALCHADINCAVGVFSGGTCCTLLTSASRLLSCTRPGTACRALALGVCDC